MNKFILFLSLIVAVPAFAWNPAGNHIRSRWANDVTPENVWNEYPRPQLERTEWQNLNGLWQYAITHKNAPKPVDFEGEILVPFAVESSLSGVGRTVGPDSVLWYERTFTVPQNWRGKNVMLNFGAVDWKSDVWVNGVKVGAHTGGYTPFSLNITDALKKGDNTLSVRVWDPTDKGTQPCGKQKTVPEIIWYTPVTGIWQTVWIEPVSARHIESLRILPDIDENTLSVKALTTGTPGLVTVRILDNGHEIASGKSINGETVTISMPADVKLWSPESPAIYDLEISLDNSDKVRSYAAMRKFSVGRDSNDIVRLMLNNKPIFQFGPLDQGWWPDGLYTAPSYEAMIYDIDKTKDLGFNTIRKHIKVEPSLWYEYCDRKGVIVWQDMPCGDAHPEWQPNSYFNGKELVRTPESEANYRKEWREIIDALYNFPCIGMWIPFNERWGQFKTEDIAVWTKSYDPSRVLNPASGGNFYHVGDVLDIHHYPAPRITLTDPLRATVLGEYGGIGLAVEGHLWFPDRNWGYVQYKTSKEVTDEYVRFAKQLGEQAQKNFTGAIYTQTTDVEMEVNGLMTYDREMVKVDEERVRQANKEVINIVK